MSIPVECPAVSSLAALLKYNLTLGANNNCCNNITVVCSFGRVTEIHWKNQTSTLLSGKLDSSGVITALSSMNGLKKLDIQNQNITGTLLGYLPVASLTMLKLNGNRITGNTPTFNTVNLVDVDLSNNLLSGTIQAISNSLISLNIANNKINGSLPKFTPNLLRFNASGNLLTGNFTSFGSLVSLDVSKNYITGVIPTITNNLTVLQLQNNQIRNVTTFNGTLSKLNMSNCDISSNLILYDKLPLIWSQKCILKRNLFVESSAIISATSERKNNYIATTLVVVQPEVSLPILTTATLYILVGCSILLVLLAVSLILFNQLRKSKHPKGVKTDSDKRSIFSKATRRDVVDAWNTFMPSGPTQSRRNTRDTFRNKDTFRKTTTPTF